MNVEPYRDEKLPERFLRWIETLRAALRPVPKFNFGSGSPEGVVMGVKGDRYYNRTGSGLLKTLLWVKTTDTGNTGWWNYG